jgi:hypothetical protein
MANEKIPCAKREREGEKCFDGQQEPQNDISLLSLMMAMTMVKREGKHFQIDNNSKQPKKIIQVLKKLSP